MLQLLLITHTNIPKALRTIDETMKELKTKEEAKDFVFNQLHTCRMMDTTWDEYMELILRLGIVDSDKKAEAKHIPKPFFSKTYWYLLALFLSLFLLQMI